MPSGFPQSWVKNLLISQLLLLRSFDRLLSLLHAVFESCGKVVPRVPLLPYVSYTTINTSMLVVERSKRLASHARALMQI